MAFDPASGPLKPRRITARDFYLNVVDVSDHRWLIVKFTEEATVRWRNNAPWSKTGANLNELRAFLGRHPDLLFYPENETLSADLLDFWERNGERNTGQDLANLNNFYVLQIRENAAPLELLREVIAIDIVETAFYAPRVEPACADVAPVTPNHETDQTYTAAAPGGVDAQFAWTYYDSAGRGNPNAWLFDIELNWTENHEDFPSDFSVYGGDGGAPADHGDAVIGVLAACHNGYGVTGLSSSVHPKAVSWPRQSGSDWDHMWMNSFNLAAANLFAGESYLIEIHAGGPNPGYSCDYGCGNCTQFGFIAVEYWDNTFAAIQTHTANGLLVYEAAGNGQANLDAAAYGSRFQTSYRNSNAILVGASNPNTRQAMCWSNYGSRVDMFAWGTAVWTCGYGYGWAGSTDPDRTQWYNNTFNGTSSATPIVTAAGNELQGILQIKYGTTFNATQMHTYLASGGTPYTGAHDIGVQPDLADAINAIEPDVAPQSHAGWYSALVPRNANDATGSACALTALMGNTNTTYWNVYNRNNGVTPAPDGVGTSVGGKVFLDGDANWWMAWSRVGAGTEFLGANQGPLTVRGGRHSIQWYVDDTDAFRESNENNNTLTAQFVWSPLQLTAYNATADRAAPPLKSWGNPVYFNGDGFRGSPPAGASAYWLACAVLPQSGNDLDVYSYADSYSNTTGFDTPQKTSARGAGLTDLVLINGNTVGAMNRLFQAIRYSEAATANYKVEVDAALTASYYPPYSRSVGLGASEVMNLYEIWLSAGAVYYIGVQNVTGGLDLSLNLYGPGGDYYKFSDAAFIGDDHGANEGECRYWTPTASGWHCAAVVKKDYTGYGVSGSYTFTFDSPGTPNIKPAVSLSGWDAPVVARNTADATTTAAHFPAALQGGSATYLNFADGNAGTAPAAAGFSTRIWLDNVLVQDLGHVSPLNPMAHSIANNWNSGIVRGGRHTLQMTADNTGLITESNESDNSWSGQYVWSPAALNSDVPTITWTPPQRGSGTYPNSVGFQFTSVASYAAGAATLPKSAAADYDAYLYRDCTGTNSGFSDLAASSTYGSAVVDYVLVPWRQTQLQSLWYPALISYTGTDSAVVDFKTSVNHAHFNAPWAVANPDTISANGLWQLYECCLSAGTTYRIFLDVLSGAANLELRLHRDSTAFQTRPAFLVAVDAGSGDETLIYTPSVTDWYIIVVAKTSYADWGQSAIYSLSGAAHTLPPAAVEDLVIEPQPTGVRIAWSPVNVDTYGNPLLNRRYVVYRSPDINIRPRRRRFHRRHDERNLSRHQRGFRHPLFLSRQGQSPIDGAYSGV